MKTRKISFEIPADLADYLGEPGVLAAKARRGFILELLRDECISQGKAAHLLEINRWDMLDIMAEYSIPSGPRTAEEMDREIETLRRLASQDLK